jgi:hypothetical protein
MPNIKKQMKKKVAVKPKVSNKPKVSVKPKSKSKTVKRVAIGAGLATGAIGSALLVRKLSKDPKVMAILEKIKNLSLKKQPKSVTDF